MSIEVFDCIQGSPEWFTARLGLATASEFATVLSTGRGGGESKTRRTYLYKLAGERITGTPMESYTNKYMERGKALEPEGRDYYAFLTNSKLQRVGFIKNTNKGCSPDSLIGNDGMLEVKTEAPHLLIERLETDKLPDDHYAQLQGNLWVSEREWIDAIIYYPGMPASLKRVFRDDTYILKLASEVNRFNDELDNLVERIKARR